MSKRGHKNSYTDLAAEFVRKRFWYEPWTGQLSYRIAPSSCFKIGGQAGTLAKSGYIRLIIEGRHYFAHRLIWLWMTGAWPKEEIDHVDGNRANNKWTNLREALSHQNMHYRGIQSNNTSGFKGVWKSSANRWCAEIRIKGVRHVIGHFKTPEEASKAYNEFAKKTLGEFHFDKHQ